MNKEDVINILLEIHPTHRSRKISDHKTAVDFLNIEYPGAPLNMQIHALLNNIKPYCKICNNIVKTIGKETCSTKCREELKAKNGSMKAIVEKRKKTWKSKFSDKELLHKVIEKRNNTMLNKYGAKVSHKSLEKIKNRTENLQTKGRNTLFKKYGVNNPGQLKDHFEKVKETMIERYGVKHIAHTQGYKNERVLNRINHYNKMSPDNILVNGIETSIYKEDIFEKPNKIVKFICSTCNSTESLPTETFKWRIREFNTPCAICSYIRNGSRKENEIREYIENLGIRVVKDKTILNGKEIDIFAPEFNVGIEFNGLFWHNDLRVSENYHLEKTELANSKNVKLIHIFEDEWDHKNEIVKLKIADMFGKTTTMPIEEFSIREISEHEAENFLSLWHIDGYIKSTVKIGLFNNNILNSVMLLSGIDDNWEILRVASNSNLTVSAVELLRYFIVNYNPMTIHCFSDKRWCNDMYSKMGFKITENKPIKCWFVDLKDGKRYRDYINGRLKIWDCGHSKWVWKNDK